MNSTESANFPTSDVRLLTSTALEIDRRVGEGDGLRWRQDGIWSDVWTVAFGQESTNRQPTDLRSSWNAYRSSSQRLLTRSRSMIRTNPWIGSGTGGDSPPRSPGQTTPPSPPPSSQPPSLPPPPLMYRSWSMVETGKTQTTTTTMAPPTDRFNNNEYRYSNNKYSNNNNNNNNSKYPLYSREDSLLTTSIETDSFCPSEFSDAETTTSMTSFGDVCLTPTESDVISYDPPTKMAAVSKHGAHLAGSGDGADHEGYRFLFETLNAEKIRRMRRRRVNISSFSSSGLNRQQPGVERSSETNWEEEQHVSKSVRTIEGGGIFTAEQIRRNSEIQTKSNSAQRTERHAIYSREDALCCDTETKRAANGSLQRKILTIRSSLRDKVSLLKHEKRVVDRKIREAKEEERIRIRQLEEFRQQLAQTRREILLRTLEDIKRTLALQVLRLQKVYDFVLLEQRQSFDCQ